MVIIIVSWLFIVAKGRIVNEDEGTAGPEFANGKGETMLLKPTGKCGGPAAVAQPARQRRSLAPQLVGVHPAGVVGLGSVRAPVGGPHGVALG